ncbi:uncharacterized protein VTP21DRAFT_8958 [Calcarisporiella thermophila]|uniref:uncharacterized protein n=1 Tax=Calcarisporiella thermophila TaxID=911321 RepID=UPI003742F586
MAMTHSGTVWWMGEIRIGMQVQIVPQSRLAMDHPKPSEPEPLMTGGAAAGGCEAIQSPERNRPGLAMERTKGIFANFAELRSQTEEDHQGTLKSSEPHLSHPSTLNLRLLTYSTGVATSLRFFSPDIHEVPTIPIGYTSMLRPVLLPAVHAEMRRAIDINLNPVDNNKPPPSPDQNQNNGNPNNNNGNNAKDPNEAPTVQPNKPPASTQPPVSEPPPITSTITLTPSRTPPPATSRPATTTSAKPVVTSGTITSYVTVPPPSEALPGPTAAAQQVQPKDDGSGGQLVTAGIAIGCVVVAAAIGIWIFRKWKLSPSRDFKEKIQGGGNPFRQRTHESDTVFLRELQEP